MNNISLALITGVDIPIPELQLVLHQPSCKEIGMFGEQNFVSSASLICAKKESLVEDESLLKNITDFQILIEVINQYKKKADITTFFSLLFPSYKLMITPRSFIFNNFETKENVLIDESNLSILQEYLREAFCLKESSEESFNPANETAKKIKDKILKGRRRVAELKEKENDGIFARYISILSIALHKTPLELRELTMYQVLDLVDRFGLWVAHDTDMRVRLAGGHPDKEAENWMKNIH